MILELTDGMRANWIRVHAEERDGNKGAVASETQDGISELEGGVVFVRVPLVEVNVCTPRVSELNRNKT